MPEVLGGFPRAYAEFVDPADPDQVYRCDLTWLTSRWRCIYGAGCQGIYTDGPEGCCTLGAHFSDRADETRVRRAVRELTADLWQHRAVARSGGWVVPESPETVAEGERPARVTRIVDGACIFLNQAGFEAGQGCALHLLADRSGRPVTETKPDVCWQLPLRRQFRTVTRTDQTSYLEITIAEYGRDGWGPGGADLDWYCTANTEAHHGTAPVYLDLRVELVALMGEPAYAELAELCAEFASRQPGRLRHPADPPPARAKRRRPSG